MTRGARPLQIVINADRVAVVAFGARFAILRLSFALLRVVGTSPTRRRFHGFLWAEVSLGAKSAH